jgi:DNA repair protein RadC
MDDIRSIKKWSPDDRPREKLLNKGAMALSDAELLSILIGTGTREQSAVDIARKILNSVHHDLHELGKLGLSDFKRFHGMGEAKSVTLLASPMP